MNMKRFGVLVLVAVLVWTGAMGAAASETEADVIVVGAGGAGLTAAIEAALADADVIVLEKQAFAGGNTLISGGIWNAAGTWLQEEAGYSDSVPLHVGDTIVGGDYAAEPQLVGTMVEHGVQMTDWFVDELGYPREDLGLTVLGGHSVPRGVHPEDAGADIVSYLLERTEELGVDVHYHTEAVELMADGDGRVYQVRADREGEEVVYEASNGIVLATGGFGANVEMRVEHNPEFDEDYLTTNQPYITGEGITMAQEVGAAVRDMEMIQAFPMCDPETGDLNYPVSYARNQGAIIVNQEGQRYVEELERRDVIAQGTLEQTGGIGYVFWDTDIAEDELSAQAEDLMDRDLLHEADSIEEAAEFFDIPAEELVQTVAQYNEYVEQNEDPDFGRRDIDQVGAIDSAPFWIGAFAPSVHHTMGGVVIDSDARVLDENDEAIPGLFAAGEVTGGIHGTNRLGGNALLDCFVFGYIAGQNAAE